MKSCACHTSEETIVQSKETKRRERAESAGWACRAWPLFIPKCPLCGCPCFDVYRLGLNFSQAKYIRYGMIILCSASVLLFVFHLVKLCRGELVTQPTINYSTNLESLQIHVTCTRRSEHEGQNEQRRFLMTSTKCWLGTRPGLNRNYADGEPLHSPSYRNAILSDGPFIESRR
jgi:hypothetical protein